MTLDDLIAAAEALPVPPVAFEALWDGDSSGWSLTIFAIIVEAGGYTPIFLTDLQDGSDLRLFNGQVPPWPEAERARRWGDVLAAQFSVPFHFPSPDHPEDDCPRWWELAQATPCRRCGIPLLQPTDCRWAGVCYPCHLVEVREQREAAWTPEQRAGPRCAICGDPAPSATDTRIYCARCCETYHWYPCRTCGVVGMVSRTYWNGDDRCPDCAMRERLAMVPDEQQEAIRLRYAAKGLHAAADLVHELLHWTFNDALDAVRYVVAPPDETG